MSFFGSKKKKDKEKYQEVSQEEIDKQIERAQKHGRQRRNRNAMNLGQINIKDPHMQLFMEASDHWDNPPLSEKETSKGTAAQHRQLQVDRKANAAQGLKALMENEQADPEVRKLARQKFEEQKMDNWLELYETTQNFKAISAAAQDYGFGKTTFSEYEDQMADIYGRKGITEDQTEMMEDLAHMQKTVKNVENTMDTSSKDFEQMVPLREQGFDGIMKKEGATWIIEDGIGERLGMPSVEKDPRGIQTAVNGINEYVLLGQNQEKGKLAMKSAWDKGTGIIRSVWKPMLDKIPGLAGGDQMKQHLDPRTKQKKVDINF